MRVKIFLLKRDSTALHFIFVSSALRRRVQTLPALRNSSIPEGPQVEYVHIEGSNCLEVLGITWRNEMGHKEIG